MAKLVVTNRHSRDRLSWGETMCSKFRPFYSIGRVCVKTFKRMRNLHFWPWNESLCDLRLLVIGGNSQSILTAKIVYGIGSAHSRATCLIMSLWGDVGSSSEDTVLTSWKCFLEHNRRRLWHRTDSLRIFGYWVPFGYSSEGTQTFVERC